MIKKKDADKADAIARLRRALRPGSTVYAVVTHVSRSGMSRSIEFYVPCMNRDWKLDIVDGHTVRRDVRRMGIAKITRDVAYALGYRIDRRNGGVIVGGCGMDMCWHVTYVLGCALWPDGTKKPHSIRNGQPDTDGGYALRSVQL